MSYVSKHITISKLIVNEKNPRFEPLKSEIDAISKIANEHGEKLLKLASDIITNGVNPGDLIYVLRDSNNNGKYIVLEGNRRISALKLLKKPNLIKNGDVSFSRKMTTLSKKFKQAPIRKVNCVIFENEEDANHWIKLKHTGENSGIGTQQWDPKSKARFDAKISGKKNYSLQIIDFVKTEESVSDDLKSKIQHITTSNLDRLISDPGFRKNIGFDIKDRKLRALYPAKEVIKPIKKIINDLLKQDFNVNKIYTKEKRAEYLHQFEKTDLPNIDSKLPKRWCIDPTYRNSIQNNINESNVVPKDKPTNNKTKKTNKNINLYRTTLIPPKTTISIHHSRLNKIYVELKNLNINDFTNAVAIEFRVFIELTLDLYLKKFPIDNVSDQSKLSRKLKDISQRFLSDSIMNRNELKPINTCATNPNDICSINTFNAYVHNIGFDPKVIDLKTSWDNMEPFIIKLWELINNEQNNS